MCGVNCPLKLKQSLDGVKGIKTCRVNFKSKTATVIFDDEIIDRKKIANTIAKATYYNITDTKNEEKPWSLFGWLFGDS